MHFRVILYYYIGYQNPWDCFVVLFLQTLLNPSPTLPLNNKGREAGCSEFLAMTVEARQISLVSSNEPPFRRDGGQAEGDCFVDSLLNDLGSKNIWKFEWRMQKFFWFLVRCSFVLLFLLHINKEAPQFPEGLLIKVGDIPLRGTSLILFAQPPYPTILLK